MKITSVTIDNFKMYKHIRFDFGDNKLILITGPNGFGKTTLFDSIEWCLTGDISRLKKCFDQRNSKQTEKDRTENRKGIIKNSNCRENEKIRVSLDIAVNNTSITVYREQIEDSLYIKTTLNFASDVTESMKAQILDFAANENFYNYHVCDIYKSFEFLNYKRQEVKEQFENFINRHPNADSYSKILFKLQNELKDQINRLETDIKDDSFIESQKKEIELLKSNIKMIDYPQTILYNGENLSVDQDNLDKIKSQKNKIKKCGYNVASSIIGNIIEKLKANNTATNIRELNDILNNMEDDINTAIKCSYFDLEKYKLINSMIAEISDEKQRIEDCKKASDLDISVHQDLYKEFPIDINSVINQINSEKKLLSQKQREIKDREQGNEIIAALSNLVIGKEGIYQYKTQGNEFCPLCGSDDKFKQINRAEELAKEAEKYLDKNQTDIVKMKKDLQNGIEETNKKFTGLKTEIVKFHENKIKQFLESQIKFQQYYNKTKAFFEGLKKTGILPTQEGIENVKKSLKENPYNQGDIDADTITFKNILIALQYVDDSNYESIADFQKVYLDLNQLIDKDITVIDFNLEDFSKKLLFLNTIINNAQIKEKQNEIVNYEKNNAQKSSEIVRLKSAAEKAKNIRDQIENCKSNIEKLELEAVGPYLFKIFSKVIKHSIINEFQFNRDSSKYDSGATFTDKNGNNILNILSQGQLGVFMLSYFFANMFKRKNETDFKTFFVDDITSCMDDMNILSFTDIIKYLLYQNDDIINQLFFSTCNDDLEKLFIHKAESFNIPYMNIKYRNYASGDIQYPQQLIHF